MNSQKIRKRVTLKSISEQAGVTHSTASRILNNNNSYKYSDETVRRVLQVAEERGYRTNQLYRSVFSGKTNSAGVISTMGTFYSKINKGIHDRLLEDGYATIMGINDKDYDNPDNSLEEKIIHRLNEHRVDGFIMRPTLDNATDEHFREIIRAQIPLITFDRKVNSKYADFVGSDDIQGGRLAAVYLSDLGHRNIVQFAADQQVSSFRNRASGFETELIKRGCNIQTASFKTMEDLSEKCILIFSRKEHPSAIFCSCDAHAARVYRELSKIGLSIPEDVSVVGYGNTEECKYVNPELTTIDQRPYQIGLTAAELFLKRLEEPLGTKHNQNEIYIDVDLVERNSCRNQSKTAG